MNRTFSLLLGIGMTLAVQGMGMAADKPAGGGADDSTLAKIRDFREAGEKKLVEGKFTRKVVSLKTEGINESIRQKWSKMDAYYDGDVLARLQLYPHEGISGRTEEFYFMGNELAFAFIQDKGPKHEGTDMGEPGKELFFSHGKLIHFEDRTGEKVTDATLERKMYEASLPYEVSLLLPLLSKAK